MRAHDSRKHSVKCKRSNRLDWIIAQKQPALYCLSCKSTPASRFSILPIAANAVCQYIKLVFPLIVPLRMLTSYQEVAKFPTRISKLCLFDWHSSPGRCYTPQNEQGHFPMSSLLNCRTCGTLLQITVKALGLIPFFSGIVQAVFSLFILSVLALFFPFKCS